MLESILMCKQMSSESIKNNVTSIAEPSMVADPINF